MATNHRHTARPPAALLAAAAGILGLVILATALLSFGSSNASGLSPQLTDAPPGLVELAFQAGATTGIDGNVLLAIAKVETDWGRARQAQPDELVPADIRAAVDVAALQPGGATATVLDLPDGRRIGDWVNPQPVGTEHATGFMQQFLPSTWRTEAAAVPGGPRDPYRPLDAITVARSYLRRIEAGAVGGSQHDLRGGARRVRRQHRVRRPGPRARRPRDHIEPAGRAADPRDRLGQTDPDAGLAGRPRLPHEPVRRHQPVRGGGAGDLGPHAPRRSPLVGFVVVPTAG